MFALMIAFGPRHAAELAMWSQEKEEFHRLLSTQRTQIDIAEQAARHAVCKLEEKVEQQDEKVWLSVRAPACALDVIKEKHE